MTRDTRGVRNGACVDPWISSRLHHNLASHRSFDVWTSQGYDVIGFHVAEKVFDEEDPWARGGRKHSQANFQGRRTLAFLETARDAKVMTVLRHDTVLLPDGVR